MKTGRTSKEAKYITAQLPGYVRYCAPAGQWSPGLKGEQFSRGFETGKTVVFQTPAELPAPENTEFLLVTKPLYS